MAAPLPANGQAWPCTKRSHRFPMLDALDHHTTVSGVVAPGSWKTGNLRAAVASTTPIRHYCAATTAYLDRFYISFLQFILASWSFTAYDSFASSFLAKTSKGTAGGLALLGSSDKSRSPCD